MAILTKQNDHFLSAFHTLQSPWCPWQEMNHKSKQEKQLTSHLEIIWVACRQALYLPSHPFLVWKYPPAPSKECNWSDAHGSAFEKSHHVLWLCQSTLQLHTSSPCLSIEDLLWFKAGKNWQAGTPSVGPEASPLASRSAEPTVKSCVLPSWPLTTAVGTDH